MHVFCAACYSGWMERSSLCPTCRCPVERIRKNHILNNLVEAYLIQHPGLEIDDFNGRIFNCITLALLFNSKCQYLYYLWQKGFKVDEENGLFKISFLKWSAVAEVFLLKLSLPTHTREKELHVRKTDLPCMIVEILHIPKKPVQMVDTAEHNGYNVWIRL